MDVIELLEHAERERVAALAALDASTQGELGQFFTPAPAARLIASMAQLPERGTIRVLDPGAGSGVLTAAVVDRVLTERSGLSVEVVAVERDPAVVPHLLATLRACERAANGRLTFRVVEEDFILASVGVDAWLSGLGEFDLVVENPPYGKLAVSSAHRRAMRASGLDTPNLYAAFLAISISLLRSGGQLVAITPRSFFNGPYFSTFRRYFLDHVSLERIHVFESRSTVFADTGVLQENVIFAGTVAGERRSVELSVSRGHADAVSCRLVPYEEVVQPNDPHQFIRLATHSDDVIIAERMLSLPCTLSELGIEVSTGRVVDFRSRDALHSHLVPGAAPLIYPGNVRDGRIDWPREIRKPQWFSSAEERDRRLLVPEGWYAVVKRFSAKEERRRIVAGTWSPIAHPGSVAFENHLNVFHARGSSLDQDIATGLTVWLNSSLVDQYFRTFSGHTQVNATDLRSLRYPDLSTLRELGRSGAVEQADVDEAVTAQITGLRFAGGTESGSRPAA